MSPSENGDIASGEKSSPPPAANAAAVLEKTEAEKKESAPKPASGRKKLASAAMGLMSLIMPQKDDKASADGKEEKEEEVKKPSEATGTDDAKKGSEAEEEEQGAKKPAAEAATDQKPDEKAPPPELPPVNPTMAMNNSFPMQPGNFVNMEAGNNGGYMYPPPNMMGMPAQYPPLNLPGPSNPSANGGKSFPEILYEIVSDTNNDDIISWLSHGQGFQIHNKQLFAKRILPEYFEGAKFTSFTRRLKRWSFARVSRGPELGAYYNTNFVRNQPELVQLMRYRLKEEGDGTNAMLPNGQLVVAPGFLPNPNDAGKKRELPDESDVKGTISSMRQVHGGIMPQMPHQAWPAAAMYGNDGYPQLPRPSQLPKRGKNDGKDKDGGETDGVKGTQTSSKKPKHDNAMYNHYMQFHPGMMMNGGMQMMNGGMQNGMMMNNMMGYPNAGMMSSTSNNEEQTNQMPNQIPNQMMMSAAQGRTGNVMGEDTGGGNAAENSAIMAANTPQGNMQPSTNATEEVTTNVEI